MDHSDVVSLVIASATIFSASMGSVVAWLWRHSSRLTAAEVRIKGLGDNAKEDRRRSDSQHHQVMQVLTRIDDKLDRKQDKP